MAGFKKKYEANNGKKEFATSYSKIKNFETCPRRYYTIDIMKQYVEKSAQLDRGNRLHEAMKQRVQSEIPLPREFSYMEKWAEKLTKEIHPLQIIQCELQLACTRDMKPVGYWERSVFMRTKIDYLQLVPSSKPGAFLCQIVDYKTGAPKDDDLQLAINAAVVLANYQDVIGIKSGFLYTEHGDTREFTYTRPSLGGIWREVLRRVGAQEQAHIEDNFPPKPCGLCREYCPVLSCEFHGKGKPR